MTPLPTISRDGDALWMCLDLCLEDGLHNLVSGVEDGLSGPVLNTSDACYDNLVLSAR